MFPNRNILIAIVGPTAVGKTNMAIQLAKQFNSEIISADSRQIYQEMSIGTAVPSPSELTQIKHHFIQSHTLENEINVGDYEREALTTIQQCFQKNKRLILVGGSGLFVKAICEGLDNLPEAPKELRAQLNAEYTNKGIIPLQEQLQKLDPKYFAQVDVSNPQRIIRALEVCLHTGLPFSSFRRQQPQPRFFDIITIGLDMDRETLYQRINQRVDIMMAQNLLNEVSNLQQYRNTYALKSVGYAELFEYLDGNIRLEDAIEKIKQNTRRFAKRQITWFKKTADIKWFNPHQTQDIENYIVQQIKNLI